MNYSNVDLSSICNQSVLDKLSYPISFNRSTNKLKITDAITEIVSNDSIMYASNKDIKEYLHGLNYRIKTVSSIHGKVKRYPEKDFQQVFNDILSVRIKVETYLSKVPDYLRLVDMSNGKASDDGYRAQHLYYKKDNHHYIIEIQLWSESDYKFNFWSHSYAYKHCTNSKILALRKKYDNGLITTVAEFRKELLNG